MSARRILRLSDARHRFDAPEKRWRAATFLVAVVAFLALPIIVSAQEEVATDNDVIRVAERMYCPVCENIPLDECQTTACLEWKEEIRDQLTAGRSEQAVIESFVARFGDHVVGVPQDPLLRALTVILPLLATTLAIGIGVQTFRRFGQRQRLSLTREIAFMGEASDDVYRRRLEDDVLARR